MVFTYAAFIVAALLTAAALLLDDGTYMLAALAIALPLFVFLRLWSIGKFGEWLGRDGETDLDP
jgi:hypothetical protein